MALLAWKTRNSENYGVSDVTTIGEMLLDLSGVALSDPNLSWVPAPTESIYHIGYHAASDNVGATGGYYENTVIGFYDTSYQVSSTKLQSEPWWSSQTTAETWATAYYQSGGGIGTNNRDVLFAYSYSMELNRLYGIIANAGGTQQSFVNGGAFTPLAETRGDYRTSYQMTRAGGGDAGIQFWGTEYKDDNELAILANYVVSTLGLEGSLDKIFPFKDGQSVEDNLHTVGLYVNRDGGISITITNGSTFGDPESSTLNVTIGTDDNGNYSERVFTGNWSGEGVGSFSVTSSDNYILEGTIFNTDSTFSFNIYTPSYGRVITTISGSIDGKYEIISYSVEAVNGI